MLKNLDLIFQFVLCILWCVKKVIMCLFFYLPLLALHAGFWVRNVWTQRGCGQGQRKITWHRGRRPQDRGACSYIFLSICFFSPSLFSCTFIEVCVCVCLCMCGCSFVRVFETHHNIVAYHQIIVIPVLISSFSPYRSAIINTKHFTVCERVCLFYSFFAFLIFALFLSCFALVYMIISC